MWSQLSRFATEGLRDGDGAELRERFTAGIDSLDESLVRRLSLGPPCDAPTRMRARPPQLWLRERASERERESWSHLVALPQGVC
jgi:hypothetical protein